MLLRICQMNRRPPIKNKMKRNLIVLLTILVCGLTACKPGQKKEEDMEKETKLKIETSAGDIIVKLYNETPKHRDNFIKLAEDGTYEGTLFHRVIKDFMIQAGDPESKNAPKGKMLGAGDVGYTVPAEFVYPKYFHKKGALSAARQGDNVNPKKESSGCQFYIVTGKFFTEMELDKMTKEKGIEFTPEQKEAYMLEGGTPHLDGNYTVFGEVIQGMKVVDKIQFVETNADDRPTKNIKIKSMKLIEK